MDSVNLGVEGIPHGHGLSFKRGLSDGLLERDEFREEVHPTHLHSYERGLILGKDLRSQVARAVKP